jgi:hypothetical protein
MPDTRRVFNCPRHGLLTSHQVKAWRCKQCKSPVSELPPMRVELVEFHRDLSALPRPRPRKVVHHAHC